jgi:hypothetical protein
VELVEAYIRHTYLCKIHFNTDSYRIGADLAVCLDADDDILVLCSVQPTESAATSRCIKTLTSSRSWILVFLFQLPKHSQQIKTSDQINIDLY